MPIDFFFRSLANIGGLFMKKTLVIVMILSLLFSALGCASSNDKKEYVIISSAVMDDAPVATEYLIESS